MAILTDIETPRRVFAQQYVRVDNVNTSKTKMEITIGAYLSGEDATQNPPHYAETIEGPYTLESDQNPWQQAYAIVKEKYSTYTDV